MFQTNVTSVEDCFQRRYANASLGIKLWRSVAKGRKFAVPSLAVFKVFVTYSHELLDWVHRGEVQVVR